MNSSPSDFGYPGIRYAGLGSSRKRAPGSNDETRNGPVPTHPSVQLLPIRFVPSGTIDAGVYARMAGKKESGWSSSIVNSSEERIRKPSNSLDSELSKRFAPRTGESRPRDVL